MNYRQLKALARRDGLKPLCAPPWYRMDLVFRDGKAKRVILKNP